MKINLLLIMILILGFKFFNNSILTAQNPVFSQDHPCKSEVNALLKKGNHSFTESQTFESKDNFSLTNISGGVIDSIIYYQTSNEIYKEIIRYNSDLKRTVHMCKLWNAETSTWENNWKNSWQYDNFGNAVSSVEQTWNVQAQIWENILKDSYTFDGYGRQLTKLEEKWNNSQGVWLIFLERNYSYDSEGNQINYFSRWWDYENNLWVNSEQQNFTYNKNGQVTRWLRLYWKTNATDWTLWGLFTYKYDNMGNRVLFQKQIWNVSLMQWVNEEQYNYEYDSSGNMTLRNLKNWSITDLNWIDCCSYIFTYNEFNNLNSETYTVWDSTSSRWNNIIRSSFIYNDTGYLTIKIRELWDTSTVNWRSYKKNIYTYDSEGNNLSELEQRFNHPIYGIWNDSRRKIYEYDGNGNLISFSSEILNNEFGWINIWGNIWLKNNGQEYYFNVLKLYAYYSQITNINDLENTLTNFSLYQNYPNPFNPTTTIEYDIPQNGNSEMQKVKLVVFDLLGRKVKTLVDEEKDAGSYKISFDAGTLPSGVYFYKITSGNFSKSKKMLLIK